VDECKPLTSGGGGAMDAAAASAECDTWRMRTFALAALRRLFTHDAGDFLDAGRGLRSSTLQLNLSRF